MPDAATTRKYAMTRLRAGDYLLPSNDATTLWRVCTYDEDGSAETWDGRVLRGQFWALWRRPFPKPNTPIDLEAWDEWEFWGGPFSTRDEAIKEAVRVAA